MANRTDPLAISVHGTNPQFLISKIIRLKIHGDAFWKEECFGLTAESLIDKVSELTFIGGTVGGNRSPTPFICLTLKLLQIQPTKEIIVEYIRQDHLKYLRALAAFYLRLTGSPIDIYSYLEPLLIDYRKLRYLSPDGKCSISRMDEFIDDCLRREHMLDIDLPGLPARYVLEERDVIGQQRISVLEDDVEFEEDELLLANDVPMPNHEPVAQPRDSLDIRVTEFSTQLNGRHEVTSSDRRRSPSPPARRRSASPPARRRSPSPAARRRSRSPPQRTRGRRSYSPPDRRREWRSPSPPPRGGRFKPPTPLRERRRQSPPTPVRRRSPSPRPRRRARSLSRDSPPGRHGRRRRSRDRRSPPSRRPPGADRSLSREHPRAEDQSARRRTSHSPPRREPRRRRRRDTSPHPARR